MCLRTASAGNTGLSCPSGASKNFGGAFAEYVAVDARLLVKIPENVTFEEAAGIGLVGFTAAQALWQILDIPTPTKPAKESFPVCSQLILYILQIHSPIPQILIWGGATGVGQYGIQLAKLSGLQVITTASPKNHDLLRSLGADHLFDYRDPEVSKKIRELTNDKLAHAVLAEGDINAVVESIGASGGKVAVLNPAASSREDVKTEFPFVYALLGKVRQVLLIHCAVTDQHSR